MLLETQKIAGQQIKLTQFFTDTLINAKGKNIVVLDVSMKSSVVDYMVICSGTSNRHILSLADHILKAAKSIGLRPLSVTNKTVNNWIVIDLGDSLIHLMLQESRDYYDLEQLWGS